MYHNQQLIIHVLICTRHNLEYFDFDWNSIILRRVTLSMGRWEYFTSDPLVSKTDHTSKISTLLIEAFSQKVPQPNRIKHSLLLNLHHPIYSIYKKKYRMECLKNFNIFGNKKKPKFLTESHETDLSRPFIDVAPVTQDPDTEETEDDVMETKQVKTSEKKLKRHDNYWTLKHKESQPEKHKESSLNIAWCGESYSQRSGCEWSWRENRGLFGGSHNGVGSMRRYWQKY